MERRPRRVAGVERRLVVDLQRPRQVGRAAEQLLVEVVAPATDGLGQRQRRGGGVDRWAERDAPTADEVHPDEDAGEHAARDAEAALPDLDDVAVVALEALPVRDDVVQAGPDDAGQDAPDRDGVGVVAGADALLLEPPAEQPHGGDDAEGDHQSVGVERQRTDRQRARRRARDVSRQRRRVQQPEGAHVEPVTLRTNSIGARKMTSRSKSCVATW